MSRRPYVVLALSVAVAVAVALVLLWWSGALGSEELLDPGFAVRVGLPAARAVHDVAAAVTVGLLVVCAWCITPDRGAGDELSGTSQDAVRLAGSAAVIWLVSALVVIVLTAASVAGVGVGSPGFSVVLVVFLGQLDLGRALGVSAILVLLVAVMAKLAIRWAAVAAAAVVAVVALLPLALGGHAAGSRSHMNSVDSLAFHLVASCVWVGGLAAMLVLAGRLGSQLLSAVGRYSTLAGCCFAVVAVSGVTNALLRLGSLDGLLSGYGLLVLGKTVALVVLGLAGYTHRRLTMPQLPHRPSLFRRLAAVEVVVMGATVGLAVALSRSAPPATGAEVGPITALLGFPAPPPLTPSRYLSSFYPDLLWLTVGVVAAVGYVAAVVRLSRRGVRWPWLRTVSWLVGCGVLVWVTSGGPGVYGRLHFSTHMVQHMALMSVVPLLWVLAAPLTLALRALKPRTDGSLGPRETLLKLVRSPVLRVLAQPLVAAALFVGGLGVFYYTDLLDLALFTHTGHVLMTAHFLLCLLYTSPSPRDRS